MRRIPTGLLGTTSYILDLVNNKSSHDASPSSIFPEETVPAVSIVEVGGEDQITRYTLGRGACIHF